MTADQQIHEHDAMGMSTEEEEENDSDVDVKCTELVLQEDVVIISITVN